MLNQTILTPTSIGDIIDGAVRIYRNNFAPLLALVAIPGFVTYLGTLMTTFGATDFQQGSPTNIAIGLVLLLTGYALVFGVGPIIHLMIVGGLSRSIADHIMLKQKISVMATLRLIYRNFGKLLGAQILVMLILGAIGTVVFFVLYILIIIVSLAAFMLKMPTWLIATVISLVVGIGIVGGVVGYAAIYARVIFVPCAIMIEGQAIGDAIQRSMALGSKNWWRVLSIILFDFAIALAFAAALGVPLSIYGFISGTISDWATFPKWLIIGYSTIDQLGKMLTIPISATAYTLLYFDSRVRKEGYDVELLTWYFIPPLSTPPPIRHNIPNNEDKEVNILEETTATASLTDIASTSSAAETTSFVAVTSPEVSENGEPNN